ncbi:MAG: DUF4255 domain-containing protein [Pseudomonadota bacterium]
MPSFSVLNSIAKELQAQIVEALNTAPDVDFDVDDKSIILLRPASDLPAEVMASLYLYHVDVDPHLRNRRRIPDAVDPVQMVRPPLPLQLRFLFVPVMTDEAKNQMMLGRVLQHFHDVPTFRPLPGSELDVSRGGAPEEIRVRHDFIPVQELANLWSGLSYAMRLSAGLMVEIVTLDSGAPSVVIPRVDEVFGVTSKLDEGV